MSDASRFNTRRGEEREFLVILILAYPFFFVAALIARLLPARDGALYQRGSVFAEARAAAYRTIPYAF